SLICAESLHHPLAEIYHRLPMNHQGHSFNVEDHRDFDLNAEDERVVPPSVRHSPFVKCKF
ncbi:unnamed protein product, partial [Brassica rapa]